MLTQRKKIPRTVDVSCDGCSSEFLETSSHTFRDAMADARDAGWVAAESDGKWSHYCPGCARRLGID